LASSQQQRYGSLPHAAAETHTFLAPRPQARAEVEEQVRRVAAAFAAFERDRDGVLAELGALEAELEAPRAAALDPLPGLDAGPDEVRQ